MDDITSARISDAQAAHQALLAGDRVAALMLAERAAAGSPDLPDLSLAASVLSHCDRPDLALPLFDRATALAPRHPGLLFNLATAQRACGALAEAEATIGRLLAINPADGEAHYLRVSLRRQNLDDPGQAMMERALAATADTPSLARVALHFAMGKALDDQDEFARAFAHFDRGNQLRRATFRYALQDDLAVMAALAESVAEPRKPAVESAPEGPIFIVGLPRGGTTLVEQILGAHRDVTPCGELEAFPQAVVSLTGPVADREEFVIRSRQLPAQALARRYLDLVGSRTGGTRLFTDKLPLNGLYVGLIRHAFPAAPILLVDRDAMANGLSMYSTLFAQAYPFSYELNELGGYIAGWRRLMDYWRQRFDDNIFSLSYEALASTPNETIGRVLAYCRLPLQDACLTPHRSNKPVSTASSVQVRQPIHTRSIERWKYYGRWLQPLSHALHASSL